MNENDLDAFVLDTGIDGSKPNIMDYIDFLEEFKIKNNSNLLNKQIEHLQNLKSIQSSYLRRKELNDVVATSRRLIKNSIDKKES